MKPFSLKMAGLFAGLALVLFFAMTPALKADEWNLETRIVPDHQIEVPGAVLNANTPYFIKLLDSPNERKVVQVFNEDRDHLMSMFIAVSAERLQPVDKPTFEFMEVPAGHPVPVQTWFHPGRRIGLEFVYPKDQTDKFASYWSTYRAEALAKNAPAATDNRSESAPEIAAVPAPAAIEQTATVEQQPAVTDQAAVTEQKSDSAEIDRSKPTEPEPVQIAQNTDTNANNNNTQTQLPHTAGALQLLGLVGAMSATLGAIRIRR